MSIWSRLRKVVKRDPARRPEFWRRPVMSREFKSFTAEYLRETAEMFDREYPRR